MQVSLPLAVSRSLPTDTADEDIHICPEEGGFNVEHVKLMTANRTTLPGGNSGLTTVPYNSDQQSNQAPKTVILTYSIQQSFLRS
jgi:hypothetical protein